MSERDDSSSELQRIKSLEQEYEKLRAERDALKEQQNNSELDCTDAASPAWWRGEKYGVSSACAKIREALSGKEISGVTQEPLQTLRVDIAKLRAERDALKQAGDEMAQALFNATRVFEFRRLPAPLYTAEVENCLSVEHALQQHCEITWGHRVTCKCNWRGAEPPRDEFWCPECKYSVEPLFAKMIKPKE